MDDTFTFIKKEKKIDEVKNVLNEFHKDIKFTHEVENRGKISFLDVSVTRKTDGTFSTEIYRKKTDTNVYINWKSFSPKSWKIGTLKGLFRRAFVVCSAKRSLEKEIIFLQNVFTKVNGYPSRVVNKTLWEMRKTISREKELEVNSDRENIVNVDPPKEKEKENEVFHHLCLPYKGVEGENVMKKFNSYLNGILPKNVKPRIIYKGKKIGSFFTLKDQVSKDHKSELIYGYYESPDSNKVSYVGETNVRFGTRSNEHIITDKKSAIFKHIQTNNLVTSQDNFRIMETGFHNTTDRKLAEALYIKEHAPSLNEQVRSYKLCLFN